MDAAIISDPLRAMVTATRQNDGRNLLRAGNRIMILTDSEIEKLYDFSLRRLGVLQRH